MFGKKKYEEEIKRLKNRVQELETTIEEKDNQIRDLGKAFSEATKEPPAGCKKGNWCQACAWNKPIISGYSPYAMTIGVCMKNSCESFVQRKETVSKK